MAQVEQAPAGAQADRSRTSLAALRRQPFAAFARRVIEVQHDVEATPGRSSCSPAAFDPPAADRAVNSNGR